MRLELNRCSQDDKQTLGELYLLSNDGVVISKWKTLELPDLNNKKNISRIPAGKYNALIHNSPKFGKSLWIQNVPNRSEILIHKGNYHSDIRGCILIGQNHIDINNDRYKDVTSSTKSINKLMSWINGLTEIEIHINDEH